MLNQIKLFGALENFSVPLFPENPHHCKLLASWLFLNVSNIQYKNFMRSSFAYLKSPNTQYTYYSSILFSRQLTKKGNQKTASASGRCCHLSQREGDGFPSQNSPSWSWWFPDPKGLLPQERNISPIEQAELISRHKRSHCRLTERPTISLFSPHLSSLRMTGCWWHGIPCHQVLWPRCLKAFLSHHKI